jgi:hypothetical protein
MSSFIWFHSGSDSLKFGNGFSSMLVPDCECTHQVVRIFSIPTVIRPRPAAMGVTDLR